MKKKNQIIISIYFFAVLIILHWCFIASFDDLLYLHKKGFSPDIIETLPFFLKPLYKGTPNLITLIALILFTFPAVLFSKEKSKSLLFISMSSFVLIFLLFLLF
ncbi:MAG TPA: hypothetical protein PK218_02170 [Flavobacterium sp.]|uniref:hypothetical protein n=2 Tax=Flavobacterium sp. TaxID=239 RepID=UPI002BA2ADC5|nr:hypothetical protein [Flavobacterium sp.]MCA0348077.1 hypothetical protein [Bacteroidota bacterium]HPW97347.1 hypothetical protein [Flavobacterium sp.]HQA73122.1 hypothetical protein [Flavobacterium sp.]